MFFSSPWPGKHAGVLLLSGFLLSGLLLSSLLLCGLLLSEPPLSPVLRLPGDSPQGRHHDLLPGLGLGGFLLPALLLFGPVRPRWELRMFSVVVVKGEKQPLYF